MSSPPASGPSPRLSRAGKAIFTAVALLLAAAGVFRWVVVGNLFPLGGFAGLDFLRLNLGYNLLVLLWTYVILQNRRHPFLVLLVAVLLLGKLIVSDLLNTGMILTCGSLPPSDVALYMTATATSLPVPIGTAEAISQAGVPLLMVLLALHGWRQLHEAPGLRRRARGIAAAGAALLAAAAAPPVDGDFELSLARPSYLYHCIEYLKKQTYQQVAATALLPAPGATALAALGPASPGPASPGQASPAPASPGQASPAPAAAGTKPRNLVIIALESVGALSTGLSNPELRQATPYLQSLAASSWVADRAYAVIPHTSKALVAINCGFTPYPQHPIFESNLGLPGPCLAELLGGHGYSSFFLQSPSGVFENRRALAEQLGFDHFLSGDQLDGESFQVVNYFGYEDEILLKPSRLWLEQRQEPFFTFYLTGTTHHPYWAPDRYGFIKMGEHSGEHQRFLNGVRYLDRFVQNVIEQHKQLGLYENTVFVVVGDHGESLGEHGRLQHNATLYDEVLRVPLLIHAPGLLPPSRESGIVSQLDLVPSLLPLLGFAPQDKTEGIAHFPPGGAARQDAKAYCWYEFWCAATVDGRYKYIFNFDQKAEELYDLEADPHERNNLAESLPAVVEPLRRKTLESYYADVSSWEAFLRTKDPDFWSHREASLGEDKVELIGLPADDRRLGIGRQ